MNTIFTNQQSTRVIDWVRFNILTDKSMINRLLLFVLDEISVRVFLSLSLGLTS